MEFLLRFTMGIMHDRLESIAIKIPPFSAAPNP